MKLKKLLFLLAVLLALLSVGALKTWYERARSEKNKEPEEKRVIETAVGPEFLTQIEIKPPSGNPVLLKKHNSGEWRLESLHGVRALKSPVSSLLQKINDLKGELRAESGQGVYEDFRLSDDKAVRVNLTGQTGKALVSLLISPLRQARDMNFVRLSESNKIYAASTDLLAAMGVYEKDGKPDPKFFADLRPMVFDASTVRRIEISDGGQTVALEKNSEGVWAFDPPVSEIPNPGLVSSFLSTLANFYGADARDSNTAGFEQPSTRIRLTTGKDASEVLELATGPTDSAKKTVLVKTLPGPFVYEMNEVYIQNLKKSRVSFIQAKTEKKSQ